MIDISEDRQQRGQKNSRVTKSYLLWHAERGPDTLRIRTCYPLLTDLSARVDFDEQRPQPRNGDRLPARFLMRNVEKKRFQNPLIRYWLPAVSIEEDRIKKSLGISDSITDLKCISLPSVQL